MTCPGLDGFLVMLVTDLVLYVDGWSFIATVSEQSGD